jgi:hypothetical protein
MPSVKTLLAHSFDPRPSAAALQLIYRYCSRITTFFVIRTNQLTIFFGVQRAAARGAPNVRLHGRQDRYLHHYHYHHYQRHKEISPAISGE